jgi:hypothetical protein
MSEQLIKECIEAVVAEAPVGRAGWLAEARRKAEVEVKARYDEWRRAEVRYQSQQELAERLATSRWGVVAQWGVHSFSGLLFEHRVLFGAGRLTYDEAVRQAKEADEQHKDKIKASKTFWQAFTE